MDIVATRRLRRAAVLVPVAFAMVVGTAPADEVVDPLESGLVEEAGVSLILLDVEVRDEDGNPVPGLTVDDFTVLLNGKERPLYSADDLCACDGAVPTVEVAGRDEAAPADDVDRPSPPPTGTPQPAPFPREESRYVLYFDYSKLGTDGRVFAREEALRWIRDARRPDDLVMVAAYATDAGVRVVQDFTMDGAELAAALQSAYEDPELVDEFPMGLDMRIRNCCSCCVKECCPPTLHCECPCTGCSQCYTDCVYNGARAEHSHGKWAFEAMKQFLETLEGVPGRKNLLMFHQNGTMFPARLYPPAVPEVRVGDLSTLLEEVGAEANLSRTAIHPTYVGPENAWARNMGANLADYTGGTYNRGPGDLRRVTDAAGRGCACTYRLGLLAPENGAGRVYRAKISVRGRLLDHRHRVTYLDRTERWLRGARAALHDPRAASALPIVAAIVPVAGHKGGWDARVQVALRPDSVLHVPAGKRFRANWEVGALLTEERTGKAWEMLAVSELFREEEGQMRAVVLHEHVLEGLRPGSYELRAFVRDRVANLYGGAPASIRLPPAGKPGLVGPILLRAGTVQLRAELPLMKKVREGPDLAGGEPRIGNLPVGDRPIRRGEPIEIASWICHGRKTENLEDVQRWISLDGEPIFRFAEPDLRRSGDCASLVDVLDTRPMEPGRYAYHLRWSPEASRDPLAASSSFEIEPIPVPGEDVCASSIPHRPNPGR